MHPELFRIPFTQLTVKSYGLMMVIGFLAAAHIIRRMSRNITPDPQMITNASLYCLVSGVIGARIFYVLHYFDRFRDDLTSVVAIWDGGLELLGGVIGALLVIFIYLRYHKLPVRQYFDILITGLMLTLAFGRIGCFLSGCCFGKPAELPWAVRFPYGSDAYYSQVFLDGTRNRPEPQLKLPSEFFETFEKNGNSFLRLKPFDRLTDLQKQQVTSGLYRCLRVHPTQLYSSIDAAILTLLLYLFWKRSQNAQKSKISKSFSKPGSTFALMFILYGLVRFFEEFLRNDNPFEYGWWTIYRGGTISQNLAIYMLIFGVVLMLIFQKLPAGKSPPNAR
jgi:phosphatidylglycerol:prolipoprotein diacylglycerol transferase